MMSLATPAYTQQATTADSSSDKATIQALLVEVRQLRVALERSALLTPRMQMVSARLQTQQDRVDRLNRDLRELRSKIGSMAAEKDRMTSVLKAIEQGGGPENPGEKKDVEAGFKVRLVELEQQMSAERAQEVDLLSNLQTAQSNLNILTDQLATMEKQLQP